MKRIVVFFLIILYSLSYSQNRISDSLKLALKSAKHDTIKCKILHELVQLRDDEDIWPIYNEQLKQLSEKKLYTCKDAYLYKFYNKYLANSLNDLGFLFFNQGEFSKAEDYFFKSLTIREKIEDKSGIIESFTNLAALYNNRGDISKARYYQIKQLEFCKKTTMKNAYPHLFLI